MSSYFLNRIVEHPGRIRLTKVSENVYDVTREEGAVTQAGTPLNAASLNGAIDEANTYTDAQTAKAYESKSTTATLNANAFFNQTMDIGKSGNRRPIIAGWNVTGTSTSYCYVMGVVIEGNETDGWVVRFRGKNLYTSSLTATLAAQILWVTI